jgi:hypothetical protein
MSFHLSAGGHPGQNVPAQGQEEAHVEEEFPSLFVMEEALLLEGVDLLATCSQETQVPMSHDVSRETVQEAQGLEEEEEERFEIHNYDSALPSGPSTPVARSMQQSVKQETSSIEPFRACEGRAVEGKRKVGLDDFEMLSVIGKGGYGKVYLVRKKPAPHADLSQQESHSQDFKKNMFAMKVLKKATIVVHGKGGEQTRNERSILQELEHPFIVKLHYAFQTPYKLYLILSYAPGGELFGYLSKEKMFPEETACFYISEILLTLEHLHQLGIIYR